ncbi:hypothetical protein D3C83_170120 [compost metagenome]
MFPWAAPASMDFHSLNGLTTTPVVLVRPPITNGVGFMIFKAAGSEKPLVVYDHKGMSGVAPPARAAS